MNAKKAKQLRKEIYGNISLQIVREYVRDGKGIIFNHPASLRARYQMAKKELCQG